MNGCYDSWMRWAAAIYVAVAGCTEKAPPSQVTPPDASAAFAQIRVNTDPDGARVEEGGYEICGSTPCELSYTGADADLGKAHRLVISKAGYRVEPRIVRIGDAPVTVNLTRLPPTWTPPPRAEAGASEFELIPTLREVPY
jgi:hypothetical protein